MENGDVIESAVGGPQTAVDKALLLVRSLAGEEREIGVSELARRTRMTKSTAFRLLAILQRNEFVERVGSDYRLSAHLSDLGSCVYGPTTALIHDKLLPYLVELYEHTHETVHLAVLHGDEVAYLNKIHGHRAARSPSKIGARLPAHCTGVGKAMLAFDPAAAEIAARSAALPARTEYSISGADLLRAELARVRESGIAFDRQEAALGLSCVAVPILGLARQPLAALSVAGPHQRFDPARYAPILRRVAYDASRAIAAATVRRAVGSTAGT
ncbi:IclR family transcriptional regulator [Parafrankia sp. EUN1f]|uniref:IclR family transcriptional regulator n=1 Tax=Parafrankia sp. EUN1f TaxID=102897 RepID=UPI0001C46869|nr:IclR family transcriptional regulator [Parafrankia sp. EUN1f]EFC80742.1 transcriptional regulator, IclR family [Parafrankia sp. EUN1f]